MTMLFSGFISDVNVDIPEDAKDDYPFNIPLFKDFKPIALHPKVTFFIGDNGMGKSTLIEALAIYMGYNAEGGSKHYNFHFR